ncbi:MAG: GAF domain-containing protein [Polyangiales bacterium]
MTGKSRRDPPRGADLLEQRDTFIQTFFKKGAQLTEELLREDEQLRARMRDLENENASLRAQIASEDAMRELVSKIENLEREKQDLLSRFNAVEESSTHYGHRFAEIEAENAKLASLYVASFQLHSSIDFRTVLRQIQELLVQFVGARSYAIYLSDQEKLLAPVASEGVPTSGLRRLQSGEGPIGEAFLSGQAEWVEGLATKGTLKAPAACIPLRIDALMVGVIAVIATLEHKPSFVDLDLELFRLLGTHAASALAAAKLFALHGAADVTSSVDTGVGVE